MGCVHVLISSKNRWLEGHHDFFCCACMSSSDEEGDPSWNSEDVGKEIVDASPTQGDSQAKDQLVANVRDLVAGLGQGSNALRRPILGTLTKGLTIPQCHALFGDDHLTSTLLRYRNARVDLSRLRVTGQMSSAGNRKKLKRPRALALIDTASKWIEETTGITQSGRVRVVKKTSHTPDGLFERFQREVPAPHVAQRKFRELCSLLHVHFKVGPTDFMTCTLCRGYKAEIKRLENILADGADSSTQKLRKKIGALQSESDEHVKHYVKQREEFKRQLDEVAKCDTVAVIELDGSTYELMDRGKVKVVNATLIRNVSGVFRRQYVDLVGIPVQGRPCDGLGYMLSFLRASGYLQGISLVHVWCDAGWNDYHNSSSLGWLKVLSDSASKFALGAQIDFNYFGERHGWMDCDRHAGSGKRHIEKWLRDEAPCNPKLFLDVATLVKLLNELRNTHAFDCRNMTAPGMKTLKTVAGVSSFLHFRVQDGVVYGSMLSESSGEAVPLKVDSEIVSATVAAGSAAQRKRERKLQEERSNAAQVSKTSTTKRKKKRKLSKRKQ